MPGAFTQPPMARYYFLPLYEFSADVAYSHG